jgi:hypothetical protein
MSADKIPVVITTPCLGQGGIINDEWVDARTDLFKIVTLPSVLNIMDSQVFWGLFIGKNPTEKVQSWVEKELSSLPNVTIIKDQWNSDNIVQFSLSVVENERYITTAIADDDALSKDMIDCMREKAIELIEKEDFHAGGTFANGLMWVMSDTVDVDQIAKGRNLVRKPVLVQYLFPWIGLGLFVLQTKSNPFRGGGTSHMSFPVSLNNEGFSIHVFDSPARCWLYNRHQLAESSLLKCNSKPVPFSLHQLQDEFGIDAKGLEAWPKGSNGTIHCQKRVHRKGMIDIYDFDDMSDYVTQPYHLSFLEEGFIKINPHNDHNVKGKCRVRFYDETNGEYFILLTLQSTFDSNLSFSKSMFPTMNSCRYDIQLWDGARWVKHLPEIKIRFDDYDQHLETLITIKRMNDISDSKIVKSKDETVIPGQVDESERKYVARNRLWEITVPKFENSVNQKKATAHSEDLEIDIFKMFGILGKYKIRVRHSTDATYSMQVISMSVENSPITIDKSLLPPMGSEKIDICFWNDGGWKQVALSKSIERVR